MAMAPPFMLIAGLPTLSIDYDQINYSVILRLLYGDLGSCLMLCMKSRELSSILTRLSDRPNLPMVHCV